MGLVLKFLHERTQGEVRNLFTPKFFHTAKVQVFKEQNIKLTTQLDGKFPMVICSLIRSLFMDTCNVLAFALSVVIPFLKVYIALTAPERTD